MVGLLNTFLTDICFMFVDGRYEPDLSSPGNLSNQIDIDADTFTLRLPKRFSADSPIYLMHVNNSLDEQALNRMQIIIADENAEAVIIESYHSGESLTYSNKIETKMHLKSNARIHFYKWQQEGGNASHEAKFMAEQARDSYLGTYHVVRGGTSSQDQFSYLLVGEGATCESIGFYQSDGKQRINIDSHIQHLNSHTNSRQLYKGIADGQSHVKFNGRVMVDPGIKEVCAHQRNNNLLLSSQAQVDTKPELEIYSEDVRCSHGATVGQLDEEALFYLRSRGVENATARDLLTSGFSNEIFDAFPDGNIAGIIQGVSHG